MFLWCRGRVRWPGNFYRPHITIFMRNENLSMGRLRTARFIGDLDRLDECTNWCKYYSSSMAGPGLNQILRPVYVFPITGRQWITCPINADQIPSTRSYHISGWWELRMKKERGRGLVRIVIRLK